MNFQLDEHEWDLMEKAAMLLSPLENASRHSEAEDCCISTVIPLVKKLRMEIGNARMGGIGTMRDSILTQIDK